MRIDNDVKLDFKDVLIRPKRSTLTTRSEVDISREFHFRHVKVDYAGIPIVAANMDTTGTLEMARALDPEMINEVLDVMVQLAKEGMTMMVVTHEMGFARKVAHRVIFMDAGKIVEDAKKDDFFGTPRSERAQLFLSKILHH